ncbi:MAG: hypothetical protein ACK56F_22285 [bacterium]
MMHAGSLALSGERMRDGERTEVVSLPRGDEAVWGLNAPFVPPGSK